MKYFITLPSGRERQVDVTTDARGRLVVLVDGEPVDADATAPVRTRSRAAVAASIRIDGRQIELWLEEQTTAVGGTRVRSEEWGVVANGARFFARVESERSRIQAAGKSTAAGEGAVRSPMPGRVVRVVAQEGATVTLGMPVVVIEAMKMENELGATRDGVVKKIHVAVGATVEGGALLVEIGDP